MITLPVSEVVSVTGGELLAGDGSSFISGVAVDSREVSAGGAFIALPGERVDGHAFVGDALTHGARAVIVSRDEELDRVRTHVDRRDGLRGHS